MKRSKEAMLYSRLLEYLKPHLPIYAICTLIGGLSAFIIFSSIGVVLRQLIAAVQQDFISANLRTIALYIAAVFAFGFLSSFAFAGFITIEQKIQLLLRKQMIQSYIHIEDSAAAAFPPVEILNRISNDVPKSVELVGYYMSGLIFQPILSGLFSVIILCYVNPAVALLCISCSLLNLFVMRIASKRLQEMNQQTIQEKSRISRFLEDCIKGACEVRTYHLAERFYESQTSSFDRISRQTRIMGRVNSFKRATADLLSDFVAIVSLLVLGRALEEMGLIQFSDIMLAIPLSDQISQMMIAFGNYFLLLRTYAPRLERIFEIIDIPKEGNAIDSQASAEKTEFESLDFNEVVFSYGSQTVLNHVSFTLAKGMKIGLIGESGSGKSTILKLLLGLRRPSSGQILINGKDSLSYPLSDLRSFYSYMPQDLSAFNLDIARNIALGQPFTEKAVENALRLSHASSFLKKREAGLNTILGESASGFSGGELQRLMLARCIFRKAPIILMDEPTSALDTVSRDGIKQTIESLPEQYSVIAVTHSLDLTENFDKLFLLDKGQIVESGSHKELMQANGLYARLWRTQHAPSCPPIRGSLCGRDKAGIEVPFPDNNHCC